MSIKYEDENIPYIDLGEGYKIRLEYEDLTDEKYLEKARVELRETPEIVEKSLAELRQLVKDDDELTFPADADEFLITFLRPCKFYAQSAFEKIQKYFRFNQKHKKVCENITVESVQTVFDDDLIKYLPLRDLDGRRILYLQCGKKWHPSRVSTHDIFRAIQLSLWAAMAEPLTQVNGCCVIMDFNGLSLSQICHFTPPFAAMVLDWIQHCISVRLKAVYIINNSYVFNVLFAIFKPFIGAKLRKRIHFMNKDWSALSKAIGPHALRKEFGGDLPVDDVDGKLLAEFLSLFNKQFELMSKAGYDMQCDDDKKKLSEGAQEALSYITKK